MDANRSDPKTCQYPPLHPPAPLTLTRVSGRKLGLNCTFNTQTPHLVHTAIRNECSELVCFRLRDNLCLDMAKRQGFDVEEIKALPGLQFIARNLDSGGEVRGAIKL